ncbi:T9SS type A sorting domain-containing protein [Tellurirhabdus bombi]|uniref:T9SS type A sorting domain-containing protein n=1 Tax=Tellurirhabdus bombi TaxID=2907205 RepID=UPI001F3B3284|nr:T9SS type A sorting domain-containing protein [Tellurirhabdus bombi]
MKKLFTVLYLLILPAAHAQFSFQYDTGPSVKIGTQTLVNPWAGGVNAAQYSRIHLNTDAVEDLVLFDRKANRVMTFIAEPFGASYRWKHAPQYESQFPRDLLYWMLLVDYDQDGKKDLFTHAPSGLRIFRNTSENGKLSWVSVIDPVYGEGLSSSKLNLYISSPDIPAITDADGDGDIDIITFELNGNTTEYWQNMSVERHGNPKGLEFKKQGLCWGNFKKEYCNDFVFGLDCSVPSGGRIGTNPNARPMHVGNASLLLDLNGDGKKDMLFGHISCDNVAALINNGGNGAAANFQSFKASFPEKEPILFDIFPAIYWEDVDFDGKKDLLASPNVYENDGNLIDFRNSTWFYHNGGTNELPDFGLVQKNFLQNEMIEVGERAVPAFADLDGDGDQDLIIGNAGVRNEQDFRARLTYFENTGTAAQPVFERRTEDYLNLSATFKLTNLQPAFVDLDGNGSLDLVFAGVNANRGMDIRYLPNQAARGAAMQFVLTNVQTIASPDRLNAGDVLNWADIDLDGKVDLLIGKTGGSLEYHRNVGTGSAPQFALQNQNYGKIGNEYTNSSASVALVDLNGDGIREVVIGDYSGLVKLYQLPENPDATMKLLDSTLVVNSEVPNSKEVLGANLALVASDLNGDELPDLVVGTLAGGLHFLKNTSEKVIVSGEEPISGPWAFPNPTDRYVQLVPPADGWVEVLNLNGQTVGKRQSVKEKVITWLDLGNHATGVYILRFTSAKNQVRTQKVVVAR